jgi:hypothetical protein
LAFGHGDLPRLEKTRLSRAEITPFVQQIRIDASRGRWGTFDIAPDLRVDRSIEPEGEPR